jgi:NADPH:quinone reductase-like Zn-dependent oxidoreductase
MTVLVDREYPLSDAANAHQYVESHEQFGKVVLLPHTPHPTP